MSPQKYAFRIILGIAFLARHSLGEGGAEPTPSPFPGLVVLEFPEPPASPAPQIEPSPTPGAPTPPSSTLNPQSSFSPDPDVVNFIVKGNPFTNPPWLFPQSTDPSEAPGVSRFSTFLISTFEPHVSKDGDAWKIDFKP